MSDIKIGAHWIYPEDSDSISCICSFCKFEGKLYENDVGDMPYCPRCGNRMLNIPIKHAHWIMHDDEILGLTSECSNCHIEGMYDGVYCNICGAKMSEENVWIKESMGKAIS